MGDDIYDKIRGDITDIMGDNKSDVRGVGWCNWYNGCMMINIRGENI